MLNKNTCPDSEDPLPLGHIRGGSRKYLGRNPGNDCHPSRISQDPIGGRIWFSSEVSEPEKTRRGKSKVIEKSVVAARGLEPRT